MSPSPSGNRLLSALASADRMLLEPNLEIVTIQAGEVLAQSNASAPYAYFIRSGLVATVLGLKPKQDVEVGLIGREGFVGLPIIFGVEQCPLKTTVLVTGEAHRIAPDKLSETVEASSELRAKLLSFAHTLAVQTSSTIVAQAALPIECRLARWLLMAQDRLGNELAMTHDFLAKVLGTRRPGVTTSLHKLEGEHCLKSQRGRIVILDRTKLEALAGQSYGIAEAEYRRVIGD